MNVILRREGEGYVVQNETGEGFNLVSGMFFKVVKHPQEFTDFQRTREAEKIPIGAELAHRVSIAHQIRFYHRNSHKPYSDATLEGFTLEVLP